MVSQLKTAWVMLALLSLATAGASPVLGQAVKRVNEDGLDQRIEFQGTVEPGQVRRGQVVKLSLTGTPGLGFHSYPLTQRSAHPAHDDAFAPKWKYEAPAGL